MGLASHVFKNSAKSIQGVINETGRNKHKTSSIGKVKDRRETNTTINHNLVTYNVDVPRSKSFSLN